jgi:hypothetical protein
MKKGNITKVRVLIPVYKEKFTHNEICSIKNTIVVFGAHSCSFIAPLSWNKKVLEELNIPETYKIKQFEDKYFKGIEGYNQLLLTKYFYQSFSEYSHVLICQPDAWVFNDQVEKWVQKPYHYFGAPLITRAKSDALEFIPFGGNGGFSLRNVKAHIKVLNKFKIMHSPRELIKYYKQFHKGFSLMLRSPLILIGFFGYHNNSKYYIKKLRSNEDVFWSQKDMLIDPSFRPAPVAEEIAFAFERFPVKLFEMNANHLPFGCHAWEKYEPDFWSQFISVQK